jgi:tetratricopeptide (TPR) repeat protein
VDPGEALMKKAALLESGKDYLSAIDLYQQVVQMGKASRHADEAAEKVKKFLSDGDIAAEYDKVLKERQLDSDLAMADSYMAAGHYDKVVECCEKVISAAPDSKQARAAKELLEEAKRAQDSGR